MNFSREMRSDLEGLEGPERFDRVCELFIAAVLWLLLLGLAAVAAMRIESLLEMHEASEEAKERAVGYWRPPSLLDQKQPAGEANRLYMAFVRRALARKQSQSMIINQ